MEGVAPAATVALRRQQDHGEADDADDEDGEHQLPDMKPLCTGPDEAGGCVIPESGWIHQVRPSDQGQGQAQPHAKHQPSFAGSSWWPSLTVI